MSIVERRRIGVRGIIWRDGKLLAVRHRSRKDGRPKDFWAIPGGGLDPGESLIEGVKRELREELGIEVDVGRLLFVQQFHSRRTDRDEELDFFFLIENSRDFMQVDLARTSHGVKEIAQCEFIDPTTETILPDFISTISLQERIDTVSPVLVVDCFHEDDSKL